MPINDYFVFDQAFFHQLSGTDWPLVIHTYANRQALSPPHSHDFNELVIVISGCGTYLDGDGNSYRLAPGYVLFLKPGMIHGYIEQQQLVATNILWFPEKLDMRLYDLADTPGYHALFELEPGSRGHHHLKGTLELTATQLSAVMAVLQRMQHEQQENLPGRQMLMVCLFGQLLTALCRYYCESDSDATREMLRMERVLTFIRANYATPICRAQLARLVAMSEVTFSRKFQQLLGCTPSEYIQTIRFLEVEKMLRSTDENLATIALRCGFTDGNYLSNTFKKRYGETPRHFRLRQRATS